MRGDFVTPDVGTVTWLPGPPETYRGSSSAVLDALRDAMRATVEHRLNTQAARASTGAAGADEAEANPSDGVATRAAVLDTDAGRSYGDRVDRHTASVNVLDGGRKPDPQLDTPSVERVALAANREAGANGEGRPDASLSQVPRETSTPATRGADLLAYQRRLAGER